MPAKRATVAAAPVHPAMVRGLRPLPSGGLVSPRGSDVASIKVAAGVGGAVGTSGSGTSAGVGLGASKILGGGGGLMGGRGGTAGGDLADGAGGGLQVPGNCRSRGRQPNAPWRPRRRRQAVLRYHLPAATNNQDFKAWRSRREGGSVNLQSIAIMDSHDGETPRPWNRPGQEIFLDLPAPQECHSSVLAPARQWKILQRQQ